MSLNNSTLGCLNGESQIPSDYHGPIFHDPNGNCYPINFEGEVEYFANYGYNPSEATGIVFTVLFALFMIAHTVLVFRVRRWWLFTVTAGCLGEVIGTSSTGWIGRTLSGTDNSASVTAGNYFLIQIVCLTICPVFFSGTCYGLFTLIIARLEPSLSRFRTRYLVWFFVLADVISLIIQAIGGGTASGSNDYQVVQRGTHIMVAGIVFQLIVMIGFAGLGIDYLLRYKRADTPPLTPKLRALVWGTCIASVFIIIRGIYRTAELAEGWSGFLITHEVYFLVFDALAMLLCVTVLLITHPAFTLGRQDDNLSIIPGTPEEKNAHSIPMDSL